MKHVTIWMNPPIRENYAKCVASQRRYFSYMDYELIDDIKSVQLLTEANEKYSGVNPIDEYIRQPFVAPDYIRCYLLSLSPYTLYLDSDVEITGKPPQFDDTPGMEFNPNNEYHNTGIIWNGTRTDIFDALCRYWFTQSQVQLFYGSMAKAAKENEFNRYCRAVSRNGSEWFIHYMYGLYSGRQ